MEERFIADILQDLDAQSANVSLAAEAARTIRALIRERDQQSAKVAQFLTDVNNAITSAKLR